MRTSHMLGEASQPAQGAQAFPRVWPRVGEQRETPWLRLPLQLLWGRPHHHFPKRGPGQALLQETSNSQWACLQSLSVLFRSGSLTPHPSQEKGKVSQQFRSQQGGRIFSLLHPAPNTRTSVTWKQPPMSSVLWKEVLYPPSPPLRNPELKAHWVNWNSTHLPRFNSKVMAPRNHPQENCQGEWSSTV